MKRKMMLGERIMYVDRNTPFNVVFTAKIRGRLTEVQLHHALMRVQAKHPQLRCAVTEENAVPYMALHEDAQQIPLRIVERRNEDDWKEQSRIERGRLFQSDRAPLARVVWVRSDEVSELLLVCHHCICDGMSVVTMLREILLLCDQPDLEIGRHASFNGIEDIVPAEVLQDRKLLRSAAIKALLFRMLFFFKRVGRPVPQGPLYVIDWKLGPEAVKALALRSKAEGVTVSAALGVAFSLAFRSVRGKLANGKFLMPVDVRKFLPRVQADSLFAASPSIVLALDTSIPLDQVVDAKFWDQSRELKASMTQKIQRMSVNVYEYFIAFERMHSIFKKFVGDKRANIDKFDVTLSNLGRIDLQQDYRDFRLETIYSPTVWLPWRTTTAVVISGYAGELDFQFISDEASLPYAQAMAIKDKTMAIVSARSKPGARSNPTLATLSAVPAA